MAPKVNLIENLTLGLATTEPSTAIPRGALTVADNVAVTDGELRSAPGFQRVTNVRFNEQAYKLDGLTQYFYGRVNSDATTLRLQENALDPFTIEVRFRLERLPTDVDESSSFPTAVSMILFKGPDADLYRAPGTKQPSLINWYATVITEGDGGNAGKLRIRTTFNWTNNGVITLDLSDPAHDLLLATDYHLAIVCDGTDFEVYLHEAGTAIGSPDTDLVDHSGETVVTTENDFFVGAAPVTRQGTALVINASVQLSVDALSQTYTLAAGTWTKRPAAGSSVLISGMSNAGNNGVKRVVESTTTTFRVAFDSALANEATGAGTGTITEYHGEDRLVQYGFHGVIQEVRIWDDARTEQELFDWHDVQFTDAEAAAETNLTYYQRLTGNGDDTYWFASEKGLPSRGAGGSPLLALMPRDASWRYTGHILTDPSFSTDPVIDLDGITQGLVIPDAYRYRSATANADGELPWPDFFGFTAKITPRAGADRQTIFHYVPALSDEWTIHRLNETTLSGTFASPAAGTTGNLLVELVDVGAGVLQFRAVLFHRSGGGTVYATSEESTVVGGILDGTEYTVTVGVDAVDRLLRIYVRPNLASASNVNTSADWQRSITGSASITAAAAGDTYTKGSAWTITPVAGDRIFVAGFATNAANNGWKTVVSATSTVITVKEQLVNETDASVTIVLETTVPATPKGDYVGTRKYAASLGRAILRTRQENAFPGDPNGVDVEYELARSFDGEIRQVAIAVPQQQWSLESFHNFVADQDMTLGNVSTVGLGIISAWLFKEGAGESIEDVASGNNIEFREDSDHVWAHTALDTAAKVPIVGLFDHRYNLASGQVQVMAAIAGGSVYSVDPVAGTATFLVDGFRNDSGNDVSAMKFQDSLILTAGRGARGNFHLWRDQLWRLDIDPPDGFIPFGLTDQKNKEASLQPGVYKALFTFYSAYTGKESPIGSVIQFEVLKNRANLAFGDVAEINQTYPTTGNSIQKEPFDLMPTGAGDLTGLRTAAWIGVAGEDTLASDDPRWWQSDLAYTGTDPLTLERPAKRKRVVFGKIGSGGVEQHNELILDIEDVTADEVKQAAEEAMPRCLVDIDPLGFVALRGVFSGSNAYLRVTDLVMAADPDVISSSGSIGFSGISALTGLYRGAGDIGHGHVLPVSNDPQVTHLRMYRTLANDALFRLAEQVPNGTRGFVHYTRDEELVGPVLDITIGPPPPVKYVSDFGGRAIYTGDELQPDFVYFSAPGQPWNVPAENVIKMADGDSIPITGVGRTEGALMIFKDDTTFLLRPPASPLVPFSIETRMRDIGCVAPRGVVNIHDRVYFPGERGMYRYDTAIPEYLSGGIETTWLEDVSVANRAKIAAVHDRKNSSWVIAYPTGDTLVNGAAVNDAMLVLDYEVGRGQDGVVYGWTRRTGLSVRSWSIVPDANDVDRIYFVDEYGFIYQWDSGTDYGVGALTAKTLTASAGAGSTVTVPQATLANVPAGRLGFFVTLVRAADASRETRLVVGDTLASPSALTVDHAWTGAAPTSGDTVLVGSVEAQAVFGEMSPYGPQVEHHLTDTFVRASKQATSATYRWEWQGLGGADTVHHEQEPPFSQLIAAQGVTISNQKVDMKFASEARGRRLAFRVLAQGVNKPFALRDFSILVDNQGGTGAYISLTT